MSNAEYVREVLLTCPEIAASAPEGVQDPEIMIDFLALSPTRYSIEGEPAGQIVKHYLGGDTIRRYAFTLNARYGVIQDEDRATNMRYYEALSLWLERQTRLRKLPDMGDGRSPRAMRATGSAYLYEREDDLNAAGYMMQLELTYFQRRT